MILDSGNRREFETGAVRDMKEGRGRMDLLPLTAVIELSKHCEEGALKYGEHNVDKGIPQHSLCDSAMRHLAKYMRGDMDENHLRAACWNLMWALEQSVTKPELNDLIWSNNKVGDIVEYIASLSYGKDSCTIPHVCLEVLKLPLTKLVTVDVMFNDELSGDYPEVAEFKQKADEIFKKRYGLEVVHLRAKMTYEQQFFYQRGSRSKEENIGKIYGFPMIRGAWCNNRLKMQPLDDYKKLGEQFWYIGYALDEKNPERQKKIANCTDLNMYPLVKAKYTEGMCMDWCKNNDLLNPTYQSSLRDGCLFCHNQGLDQLRKLRKNYPQLWKRLLYLDLYSPVSFKPDGVTLADLDRRFALEDAQMTIFDFLK